MTEDLSEIFDNTKASMKKAMSFFESELSKIRAGKASPVMLDGVVVDYYGNPTPIGQVANVSAIDARTLTVQPWEKNMLQPIERAIIAANIGVNPQNDGIEQVKKLQKDGLSEDAAKESEKEIQEITDGFISLIEKYLEIKEKEIMVV